MEYVFPDGHGGPLTRWSISDGAVHKDGRRVLTLTRVTEVAVNELSGRVKVREVRLRLDDDTMVSFGSYGSNVLGRGADGYDGFRQAFFDALAEVAPGVRVDTEVAALPKFAFGMFVAAIGLFVMVIGASKGSAFAVILGLLVAVVGAARA